MRLIFRARVSFRTGRDISGRASKGVMSSSRRWRTGSRARRRELEARLRKIKEAARRQRRRVDKRSRRGGGDQPRDRTASPRGTARADPSRLAAFPSPSSAAIRRSQIRSSGGRSRTSLWRAPLLNPDCARACAVRAGRGLAQHPSVGPRLADVLRQVAPSIGQLIRRSGRNPALRRA